MPQAVFTLDICGIKISMWKTAEPIVALANRSQLEKMIAEVENKMKKAAKDLDFITAAQFRNEMMALRKTFRGSLGGSDAGLRSQEK